MAKNIAKLERFLGSLHERHFVAHARVAELQSRATVLSTSETQELKASKRQKYTLKVSIGSAQALLLAASRTAVGTTITVQKALGDSQGITG